MAADIYFILLTIVEIIMYSFHFSIFLLLFFKRNEIFHGPFYSILRIIFAADFIQFLNIVLTQKLSLIPSVVSSLQSVPYFAGIFFNIAQYSVIIEFLGHTFISLNLFTSLWFPLKHEKIWKGHWYKIMLIFLPFLHICWRLHEPSKFVYFSSGSLAPIFTNKDVIIIALATSTVIYVTTTILSAIFNGLSFLKFVCYRNRFLLPSEKENTLLIVSLIIFAAQFLRSSVAFINWLFPFNESVMLLTNIFSPIVFNIFVWSGSVSLFFTSATVRKNYGLFYFQTKYRQMLIKKLSTWNRKT